MSPDATRSNTPVSDVAVRNAVASAPETRSTEAATESMLRHCASGGRPDGWPDGFDRGRRVRESSGDPGIGVHTERDLLRFKKPIGAATVRLLKNIAFATFVVFGTLVFGGLVNLMLRGGTFAAPLEWVALWGLVSGVLLGIAITIVKRR